MLIYYLLLLLFFISRGCLSRSFMKTTRGLLFDIDGTLSDSFRLGFESTQKVLTSNGYRTINEDEYHQGTRYTTPARLAWHSTGEPNGDSSIGIELGRQFDEMYVKLVSTETAPLYEGILPMLESIKTKLGPDLKLGALSNACGAYVEAVLKVNDLTQDFGVALGADEVPKPKPMADGLLQCCSTLSLEPKVCVYIGDSPSDGAAAAAAGMPSIGVTWGSHPEENVRKAFTYTVTTIPELEQAIYKVLSD